MAVLKQPGIIILDLGLPDMNGQDVIKALREWTQVPILVLSVRADEREKVQALDIGLRKTMCRITECMWMSYPPSTPLPYSEVSELLIPRVYLSKKLTSGLHFRTYQF